jgi:hypothetical protein
MLTEHTTQWAPAATVDGVETLTDREREIAA